MRRTAPVVVAALAALISVAACSSSSAGTSPASTSRSTSASQPSGFPSSTAPASSATPSPAETVTVGEIQKVLLSAADISSTAKSTPSAASDNPLPCAPAGTPGLNKQVPATVRAGVDITDDTLMVGLSEEIRLYADDATAAKALAVALSGLACSKGTIVADDGSKLAVSIGAPADIKTDILADTKLSTVGVNQAYAWDVKSTDDEFGLVTVQIDRSLVLFSFVNAVGADTSKLPDPLKVVQFALEKGN